MTDPTDSAAAKGSDADADQGPGEASAPAADASLAMLLDDVRSLWSETTAQARDIGELALLEFDLAVSSLLRILLAVLLLAGLCLCAWLFLVGVLAGVLVAYGVALPLALLAGALVNIVAAGVLLILIRSLTRDIRFRHLRRYISGRRREQAGEQSQQAA